MKISLFSRNPLVKLSLVTLGLSCASGCGLTQVFRTEPDHVYSTTTPQMLEQEAGQSLLPARAHYPDEETLHYEARSAAQSPVSEYENMRSQTAASSEFAEPVSYAAVVDAGMMRTVSYHPDDPEGFEFGGRPSPAGVPEKASRFSPAEPRRITQADGSPVERMETVAVSYDADLYPDEYVFDGGDRGAPAAVHTGRSGLDTEDTVAAFRDHTGAARTAVSNRVAIYAPQFGSIRTVTGQVADVKVDKAAGARDAIAVGNLRTGHAAQENIHETSIHGLRTRDRVDGMKNAMPPMQARNTEVAGQNRKVDEGHEGRNVSSPGVFNRNDGLQTAEQMRNAIVWTRRDFPVITGATTSAGDLSAKFRVQQTIGIRDERQTRGNVHIVKLADREIARSGETVRFTIRFQNTGDFDVNDIEIVDNLTPRLDYIPGSAQIDENHPGELTAVPNGEGSSVLTFRLDNPLKGHHSGTITFDAMVR